MNKLIIIFAFFSSISCEYICREDGLFGNPSGDSTSYFKCQGGVSTFVRCPEAEDGLSYQVFNGKECVPDISANTKIINPTGCAPGTFFDRKTGICIKGNQGGIKSRQVTDPRHIERYLVKAQDITCPLGTVYDTITGVCVKKNLAKTCPAGYTYIPALDKCRWVTFVSPIQEKVQRPGYTCPQGYTYESTVHRCRRRTLIDAHPAQKHSINCPPGYYYMPSLNKCTRWNEQKQTWRCPWKAPGSQSNQQGGTITGRIFPKMISI